jgi:hypothetical protein
LESDFGNDLKIDKNRLVIVKIDKYGPVSSILASYNLKKNKFRKTENWKNGAINRLVYPFHSKFKF